LKISVHRPVQNWKKNIKHLKTPGPEIIPGRDAFDLVKKITNGKRKKNKAFSG